MANTWPCGSARILLAVVAPDEEYSREGWRRVIRFQRAGEQIATFARAEYFLPDAEAGPLIWALAEAPDQLSRFEEYHVEENGARDLLVCTHGTVDAACAKFGYPL